MGLMDGLMGNAGALDPAAATREFGKLLGQGEQIHAGYQLLRDSFLFTNRRLILVDKQGITGRKTEYHSILYRSITQFSVETSGSFDLDAELKIWISGDPVPIQKQFSKSANIYEVQAMLAHFIAG
ncbi:PH domain-containing protein [Rhodococcus triatomae]|nr:hypothetical protein G419_05822 [Rhodococcus triatomae BKS 15-14]